MKSGAKPISCSAARVLSLLRDFKGSFVSGEELSRQLDVSRTAIWKQINNLRSAGYHVESEPSRGYRLADSPGCLDAEAVAESLKGRLIGCRVIHLAEVASTNQVAFKLAEEGALEGTVVTADMQSAGKGRLGRIWHSPAGLNLYCSVILRPSIQPVAAPQLTFLSVIAVARAVERLTGLKSRIKWPNDLLIAGAKVAGLLNEMSAETDKVNFVVLGIGVNLNMKREDFPPDLRHPATSLFIESGKPVDRTGFTIALLDELGDLYSSFLAEGYDPARREWLERSQLEGAFVSVSVQGETQSGRVVGIDEFGALILDSGQQILAGDVVIGGEIASGN